MPEWLQGDVLDVRMAVTEWLDYRKSKGVSHRNAISHHTWKGIRRSLNIPAQLKALGLPEFEGRQHSGIDDCRNISRVMMELARRGVTLVPNTTIYPDKRWHWMGKQGQILE
ncbi:hypothetical protein AX14_012477 [Amanita brunnescens Koide BX004]|nr:hypothetical protein AX14_012477 [Amanita brunnescens Koide BX004]